jgi:hypothetical protein
VHKYSISQFHFNLKRHTADEYGIAALIEGKRFQQGKTGIATGKMAFT